MFHSFCRSTLYSLLNFVNQVSSSPDVTGGVVGVGAGGGVEVGAGGGVTVGVGASDIVGVGVSVAVGTGESAGGGLTGLATT